MVDTDNVLLLRTPSAQAALNVPRRDPVAEAPSKWSVAAVIAPVVEAERALELFEREIASAVVTAGDTLLGYFVSETRPNNFPRLPVREDVQVLVFLVGYSDEASLDAAKGVLGDVARVLTEEGEPPRSFGSRLRRDRYSAATARPVRSPLGFALRRAGCRHELEHFRGPSAARAVSTSASAASWAWRYSS
jgi:hypothetical protein